MGKVYIKYKIFQRPLGFTHTITKNQCQPLEGKREILLLSATT